MSDKNKKPINLKDNQASSPHGIKPFYCIFHIECFNTFEKDTKSLSVI